MAEYNIGLENAKQTLMIGASPKRYICEVQREIYDFIEEHITDEEVREKGLNLIAEAFWAGKRMSDRLTELKATWDKNDWPENKNSEDDLFRRAARLNLLTHIKSVNIGTLDWCNRKCDWCPNKNRDMSTEDLISWEVMARILRQLKDYNFKGEIHPFLNGEPMADARMLTIIKSIKKLLPDCLVRIITNGDYLRSRKALDELFDTGVDSVWMNHYDGPHAEIKKAKDSVYEKLTHFGLAELKPSFYNRAGKVDYTPDPKFKQGSCKWFMHKLAFNHKGDLILCCSDFNYEVVFGNIMKNPLASILNSKLYRQYYYAHKEGKGKEMPLCKECNLLK